MKLVLYSTDGHEKNELIDAELVEILDKNSRITYIPSSPDPDKKYFNKFKDWFGGLGYTHISYFDLETEYDSNIEDAVFSGDVIYLSGGDTLSFLDSIIKHGFKEKITNFVKSGKVLIGTSAGAMIMTPEVESRQALNLVNFEFYPHYEKEGVNEQIDQKLETRSKTVNVIACREGEGLIIWDDDKYIIGEPVLFFLGNKELLERF